MRNLLLLIAKYGSTITLLFLEVICFYIIINYNQSQKEIWGHSAGLFSGYVNNQVQDASDYFKLQSLNDSLLVENSKLLSTIINYRVNSKENGFRIFETQDSSLLKYTFAPARIINKTINLRNNHITINKGIKDSVTVGMGVVSKNGIVGIVKNVSENYAVVMTILHHQSKISAAIKNNDFHGTLVWPGEDTRIMNLMTLPRHAEITRGDTILTSGYSTIFPYGIEIGTIKDFKIEGGEDSFSIDVELFNDLAKMSHVYLVKNIGQVEQEALEIDNE